MLVTLPEDPRPPSFDEDAGSEEYEYSFPEPFTLVLVSQTILEDAPDALPLYELNRRVANLGHATREVELTRIERRVKASSVAVAASDDNSKEVEDDTEATEEGGSAPRIMVRRRHIMELVHPTGKGCTITKAGERMAGAVSFYIKPWTRLTYWGVHGLKKSPLRSHWRVFPVLLGSNNGNSGEPKY